MTRRPFDPEELGQVDPELEGVTAELERYTRLTAGEVPRDLTGRVMAGVESEPAPRRRFLGALFGPLAGWAQTSAGRAVLVAGTMALAIAAVVFAGQLGDLFAPNQVGPSPAPSVPPTIVSPSPRPTLEESLTPSPQNSVEPTPVATPPSVAPTPAETPRSETPEPTETPHEEESETPRPSEDNSGPGGGGDGSS